MPPHESSEAKVSGSVVNRLYHQTGRGIALTTVRGVRVGGIVMPLRTSRIRAPATGTSTVTTRVSKPAAAARSTRPIDRSRSFHM